MALFRFAALPAPNHIVPMWMPGKCGFFVSSPIAVRFQYAQYAYTIGIGGIFGRIKAHFYMALRGQVINLVGLYFLHQPDQVGRIGQVAVMQFEFYTRVRAGRGTDDRYGRY